MSHPICGTSISLLVAASIGAGGTTSVRRDELRISNPEVYRETATRIREEDGKTGALAVVGVRRIHSDVVCIDVICFEPGQFGVHAGPLRSCVYSARTPDCVQEFVEVSDADGNPAPIRGCPTQPNEPLPGGLTGRHELPPPIYEMSKDTNGVVELVVVPVIADLGAGKKCKVRLKRDWLRGGPQINLRIDGEWREFDVQ